MVACAQNFVHNPVKPVRKLSHYKAGKVRLLGVTTAVPWEPSRKYPPLPPAVSPGTKGFNSSIWFGIFAPKGTDPVIKKINTANDV